VTTLVPAPGSKIDVQYNVIRLFKMSQTFSYTVFPFIFVTILIKTNLENLAPNFFVLKSWLGIYVGWINFYGKIMLNDPSGNCT
jgi:hypothetical protein